MTTTQTPKRPNHRHPTVIEYKVQKTLPRILEWAGAEDMITEKERIEIEKNIRELFTGYGYYRDGYELAQTMERRFGYVPDASLVEILDDASSYEHEALKEATAQWVKDNKITCPFTIGQKVKAAFWDAGKKTEVEGTVIKICEDEGKVSINCPSLGHRSPDLLDSKFPIPGTYGALKTYEEVQAV